MEHPINMDDLGVPLFLETPTCSHGGCQPLVDRKYDSTADERDQPRGV